MDKFLLVNYNSLFFLAADLLITYSFLGLLYPEHFHEIYTHNINNILNSSDNDTTKLNGFNCFNDLSN